MHSQLIHKSFVTAPADRWSKHIALWVGSVKRKAETPGGCIARMVTALADYADMHCKLYGSPIGEDGVIGKEWKRALLAIRGLLNGEANALDCGTVDSLIIAMLTEEGFKEGVDY